MMISDEAVEAAQTVLMSEVRHVVYGGNGRRRLRSFDSHSEAEQFAADFERQCWNMGVAVPRSWIQEERA